MTAEALVERIRQFGHRWWSTWGRIARGVEALAGVARRGRPGADAGRGQRVAGGRKASGAAAGGSRRVRWRGNPKRRAGSTGSWRASWWRLVSLCVSTGMAALRVRRYVITDPQFTLSHERQDALAHSGRGLCAARESGARFRRRFRTQRLFRPAGRAAQPAAGHRLGGGCRRLAGVAGPPGGPHSRTHAGRLCGAARSRFAGGCPRGSAESSGAGALRLPGAARRGRGRGRGPAARAGAAAVASSGGPGLPGQGHFRSRRRRPGQRAHHGSGGGPGGRTDPGRRAFRPALSEFRRALSGDPQTDSGREVV